MGEAFALHAYLFVFDKLQECGWRIRFHCSSDSFDSDHEHTQFNVIIFIVGYVTANIPAVQNVI